MDYICNTPACRFWSEGGCKKENAVTIQEYRCVDFDARHMEEDQEVSSGDLHFGSFKSPEDWEAYKRERETMEERSLLLELKLLTSEKENNRFGRLLPILILAFYALGVLVGCLQS